MSLKQKIILLPLVVRMVLIFIVALITATILMIFAYLMPIEPIRFHVYESVTNYEEGDHPEWANGNVSTQLDCFTDSLILNTAVFKGTGNVVDDSMENYYMIFDGHGITDSLPVSLDNAVYDSGVMVQYARYWHGHLALLKPLLVIFNVSDILTINMLIQLFLLLFIAAKIYSYYGFKRVIAFILPLIIINPITVAQSIQYSNVYYVILLQMVALLIRKDNNEQYIFVTFFLNGILTAYLDLLTYPAVALGVPLIFIISTKKDIKVIDAIKISFSWGIGFAGFWAGKWLVSSLLTGSGVIENALEMASQWTSADDIKVGYLEVLRANCIPVTEGYFYMFIMCSVLILIFLILQRRVQMKFEIRKVLALLLVGLYSFVWYYVMKTHSYVHWWMTYRNWSIVAYAVISIVTESIIIVEHTNNKSEKQ